MIARSTLALGLVKDKTAHVTQGESQCGEGVGCCCGSGSRVSLRAARCRCRSPLVGRLTVGRV